MPPGSRAAPLRDTVAAAREMDLNYKRGRVVDRVALIEKFRDSVTRIRKSDRQANLFALGTL